MTMNTRPTWPVFSEAEIEAVTRVLRSGKVNYWTGSECKLFEEEYARELGVAHGIVLANGSLALELALKAISLLPGDEVVVAPRTFIASACCVSLCGLRPVFADVDPNSGNISPATVEAVLTERTRAIIPVHLGGFPCDMDGIMALAKERGLYVIEDCAQAHGAVYRGRPTGSIGHIAAFSFCQDKIISTGGEGGMVSTNDKKLWEKMWSYKDHGKSFDTVFNKQHPPGFRWLHESFGSNWRMTEMQAAIGRIQLANLPETIDRRRQNAAIMEELVRGFSAVRIPQVPDDLRHSYYRFHVYVDENKLNSGWTRNRIIDEVNARGGSCFSGTCCEIYLERAFEQSGLKPPKRLPVVRMMTESSLMFPVYSTLGDDDMQQLAETTAQVLHYACR